MECLSIWPPSFAFGSSSPTPPLLYGGLLLRASLPHAHFILGRPVECHLFWPPSCYFFLHFYLRASSLVYHWIDSPLHLFFVRWSFLSDVFPSPCLSIFLGPGFSPEASIFAFTWSAPCWRYVILCHFFLVLIYCWALLFHWIFQKAVRIVPSWLSLSLGLLLRIRFLSFLAPWFD